MAVISHDAALKILAAVDDFSGPINRLECLLRPIENDEARRRLLRKLGDVMGILDAEIGLEARRAIRESGDTG